MECHAPKLEPTREKFVRVLVFKKENEKWNEKQTWNEGKEGAGVQVNEMQLKRRSNDYVHSRS